MSRPNLHAALMLFGLGLGVVLRSAWPLTLLGVAVLAALWLTHRGAVSEPAVFNAPNLVTSLRVLLAAALAHVPAHTASLLAVAVLTLDGVDGLLARRSGEVTPFGARYDMETDAFFVASASSSVFVRGHLGAFILLAGALRYAYVLTLSLLGKSDADAPRSRLGRYGFLIIASSLCASLWPLPHHAWFAALAVSALLLSFARSLRWSLTRSAAQLR